MDDDGIGAFLVGVIIGIIIIGIISCILIYFIATERSNLADGLCKLKFGEDYRFVEFDKESGRDMEVICEKHQKPDFDSVVIREKP